MIHMIYHLVCNKSNIVDAASGQYKQLKRLATWTPQKKPQTTGVIQAILYSVLEMI
jgi:hypothetical protein